MTVNSINGNSQPVQTGMLQAADAYSKSIQNQIANAQKQLQELSANQDMTPEDKMKKRQEIQQQINDLNAQLRQRQMELRREQQEKRASNNKPETAKSKGQADRSGKGSGLSQAGMAAMISADSSMKQAKVHGSVAAGMEGKAGVLESEIKQDENRGVDTTKKREELADTRQRAQAAASSQLSALADADKTMKEASQADDADTEKTGEEKTQVKSSDDKASETKENAPGNEAKDTRVSVDIRI